MTETATGTALVASQTVPLLPAANQAGVSAQAQVSMLLPGASRFASPQTIYAAPGDGYAEADGIGAFAGPGGAAIAFSGEGIQPNELESSPPSSWAGRRVRLAARRDGDQHLQRHGGLRGPRRRLAADGAQVVAWTLQQLNNPTDEAVIAGQVMAAVRPYVFRGSGRELGVEGVVM